LYSLICTLIPAFHIFRTLEGAIAPPLQIRQSNGHSHPRCIMHTYHCLISRTRTSRRNRHYYSLLSSWDRRLSWREQTVISQRSATVSSHTGLASVGEQIASRSVAIFGHIARLFALTSTYHLVACLVGTGNVVLVDQTTDGSMRFVTTPATCPRRYGDQPFTVAMAQE